MEVPRVLDEFGIGGASGAPALQRLKKDAERGLKKIFMQSDERRPACRVKLEGAGPCVS